jgi:hypothetical protein
MLQFNGQGYYVVIVMAIIVLYSFWCYLLLLNIYFGDLVFSCVMLKAWTPQSIREVLGTTEEPGVNAAIVP